MNFIKTFLAGLLAVVVGTFLVFFLWIFILLGIAGSMKEILTRLMDKLPQQTHPDWICLLYTSDAADE